MPSEEEDYYLEVILGTCTWTIPSKITTQCRV